jgi:hypothetical protein
LENSDDEVDINRAWRNIRENIKISAKEIVSYYELKKHKQWFDKGCTRLLKQAKLQCLQNPSEINGDNVNNIRFEASRQFRKKKKKSGNI